MNNFLPKKNEILPALYLLNFSLFYLIALLAFWISSVFIYGIAIVALSVVFIFGLTYPLLEGERSKAFIISWLSAIVSLIVFRLNVADFSLWVGDASSYTWDAIHSIELNQSSGFFPPLTSSIIAIGYLLFDVSNVACINILISISLFVFLHILLRSLNFDKWQSLIGSFIFNLLPISIWFTKTTFSEIHWQAIFLASVLSVIFCSSINYKKRYISIISLCILLSLSAWTRGTTLFLLVSIMIPFIFIDDHIKSEQLLACLLILIPYNLSFYFSLLHREPYLIGWQYSKLLPNATPEFIFGIGLVVSFFFIFLNFFQKYIRLNLSKKRLFVVFLFILLKFSFAIYYASEKNQAFTKYTHENELSFILQNFSFLGLILILVGLFYIIWKSIQEGKGWIIFILGYCMFSIPFYFQGVDSHRPHDVFFYWSRYYYSELFLIHFVLIMIALQFIFIWIKSIFNFHKFIYLFFFILLFVSCSWSNFGFVYRTAYLKNSGEIIQWMTQFQKISPIVLIFDKNIKYSSYNGPFLFSQLHRSGLNILLSEVYSEDYTHEKLKKIANNYLSADEKLPIVLCVNVPECVGDLDSKLISSHTNLVTWSRYNVLPYEKSILFNIDAYQLNCISLCDNEDETLIP